MNSSSNRKNKPRVSGGPKKLGFIRKHLHDMNNTYSAIGSIITIIAAFLGAISFCWQAHLSYVSHRDQEYIGTWTNPADGCVDCDFGNDPDRPIFLTLDVKDGHISGVMDASGWLNGYRAEKRRKEGKEKHKTAKQIREERTTDRVMALMNKYLSVRGELTFNSGTFEVIDWVSGKITIFGFGKVTREKGYLRLEMQGEHFLGIPDTAIMFRINNAHNEPCKKVDLDNPWLCKDA